MGREANIPTWWNSVLLAAITAIMLLAAFLDEVDEQPSRRFLVIAATAVT